MKQHSEDVDTWCCLPGMKPSGTTIMATRSAHTCRSISVSGFHLSESPCRTTWSSRETMQGAQWEKSLLKTNTIKQGRSASSDPRRVFSNVENFLALYATLSWVWNIDGRITIVVEPWCLLMAYMVWYSRESMIRSPIQLSSSNLWRWENEGVLKSSG